MKISRWDVVLSRFREKCHENAIFLIFEQLYTIFKHQPLNGKLDNENRSQNSRILIIPCCFATELNGESFTLKFIFTFQLSYTYAIFHIGKYFRVSSKGWRISRIGAGRTTSFRDTTFSEKMRFFARPMLFIPCGNVFK